MAAGPMAGLKTIRKLSAKVVQRRVRGLLVVSLCLTSVISSVGMLVAFVIEGRT